MHSYHVACFTILFFLLVLPLHAMAQESPAPSIVTQDGYTIVEYLDFDFESRDWFKITRGKPAGHQSSNGVIFKPSVYPPSPKDSIYRDYLRVSALCSSDMAHCECPAPIKIDIGSHSELLTYEYIIDCSLIILNNYDKTTLPHNAILRNYHYKEEGQQPPTNLLNIVNENRKKGVKHHYAVQPRTIHSASSTDEALPHRDVTVRKICKAKYHKKTKKYNITGDCTCDISKSFSSADNLLSATTPDLDNGWGYRFSCEFFDDDQKIIDYARQFFK